MSTSPRFFVPPDALVGDRAVLPPDVLHHARTVLRLRPGETLFLHDGNGLAHEAVFGDGKNPTVTITRSFPLETEPTLRIVIAQALPKTSEKVEQVLQHGTEVGAAGFLFFAAERSVARIDSKDKLEKRLERWSEIVKNAAEQSRRGILPTVAWEPRFTGLVSRLADFNAPLILHEAASVSLHSALADLPLASDDTCLLIVGPEGGLTESEVNTLAASGGKPVHLGPRILRTETAALVALTQVLYEHERR